MNPEQPITCWIAGLKAGSDAAAEGLWDRYFRRLVGLARRRLQDHLPRRAAADEEDVALSAFRSFCKGVRGNRYPQLHDRNNLWRLLVVITARKALDLAQRERRQKRGGGNVTGESALDRNAAAEGEIPRGLEQIIGNEPTPAFAAEVAESLQQLLDALGDDELRRVATLKMEGFTNAEIAVQLGCAEVTVERRLRVIRSIWGSEA